MNWEVYWNSKTEKNKVAMFSMGYTLEDIMNQCGATECKVKIEKGHFLVILTSK